MPDCIYCGRRVFPMWSAHGRCRRANREGRAQLVAVADQWLGAATTGDEARAVVERLERDAFLSRRQRGELLRTRFEERVREALSDSVLTVEEESQLVELAEVFALGREELDVAGWYTRFVQSAALRDLLHGKLPHAVLPMKLEPDEALIWLFSTAQYMEGEMPKVSPEAPDAVSIRISQGLYYRIAEARPGLQAAGVLKPVDFGSLGVTNRFAHFTGRRTHLRLPLEELRDLEATGKGVCFRRPGGGRKVEGFETGDGWFLINLLTNARNAHTA